MVELPGAVLLGLGSMLGTGVFVGLGLAAAEVGSGAELLPAIVLAGGLARRNAVSSAQLAAGGGVGRAVRLRRARPHAAGVGLGAMLAVAGAGVAAHRLAGVGRRGSSGG